MGDNLYIGPPERTTWRLPPAEFATHLARRWQVVRLAWDEDPASPTAVEFTLAGPRGEIEGCFQRDGTMLVLQRFDEWDAAEMAVWFRSLVPPEQPLLILSGSGLGYSELLPTDTAEEVSRRFRGGSSDQD